MEEGGKRPLAKAVESNEFRELETGGGSRGRDEETSNRSRAAAGRGARKKLDDALKDAPSSAKVGAGERNSRRPGG